MDKPRPGTRAEEARRLADLAAYLAAYDADPSLSRADNLAEAVRRYLRESEAS